MSKFERLKSKVIKRASIAGISIVIVGSIYGFLSYKSSSLQDEIEKIGRDSMSLVTKATSSEEKNSRIAQALEIFQKLPENTLISDGLNDLVARIRAARTLKEDLELRYKLNNLTMKFTPIQDVTKDLKAVSVDVFTNEVEVEFTALTDEIAMSFCYSMIEEAPGYMNIKSLEVEKIEEITKGTIQSILDKNQTLPALVKVNAVFIWTTVQNKPEQNEQPSPQALGIAQ